MNKTINSLNVFHVKDTTLLSKERNGRCIFSGLKPYIGSWLDTFS